MGVAPEIRTRRWKRVEYERMIECGIFRPDEHLELLGGLLVVREPQSEPHVIALQKSQAALQRAFGIGWNIRPAAPVALDEDSAPEPDLAVVPGEPDDYLPAHPSRPVLVVEISLTSLAFDREHKSSLYARAGVADYWIVNLVDRVVEVRRRPAPADGSPYGFSYEDLIVLGPGDVITPVAASAAVIPVVDLLPRDPTRSPRRSA